MKTKNTLLFLLGIYSILSCNVAVNAQNPFTATPLFSKFTYSGNDPVYKNNPLKPDEFYNPILQGCYPDPSITRKGNDYYLVCSSFAMVPGVPIFHSTDLVNWKQIGHVLDRISQLKVQDAGISAGIYAPQIKYNPFNDTFYMITTQIAGGIGNMVVKTKDPAKGWSDPYKLNFDGIDPSLFFDDDGKAYIVHNDAPDRGKELYGGHRVIKIWGYDSETDQIIPGTDKIIVDGGVDISKKPIWIEAPHIYKKNGRYYLMCAEGGTGGWHSEVIFVSDNPQGPYIPAGNNPILSQRYLQNNRENKVDWAGHADLVETPDGKYYGVFLGVRPNEKNRVNTGRETFLLPVDWTGEFPVFENGLVPISPKQKMPEGVENKTGQAGFFPNGNFTFTDNFTQENLDYQWIGVRSQREDFITITENGLKINPFSTTIKEQKPTSTLFYRQQHLAFEASVTLTYQPESEKDLAGIVCYQSESFNYVFGVTKKENDDYILLERTERKGAGNNGKIESTIIASEKIDLSKPVVLQVKAQGDDYRFNYAVAGSSFKNVGGTVSGDILSTDVAGGFTGSLIGLYATAGNDTFVNPVIFADVPDLDVIRVGSDFYMVSTTMHLMPGAPIMRSKDLVNWEIISYVFDELKDSPFYDLEGGNVYGQGQWASSLRYHKGKFYVFFATNSPQKSYIFSADDPAGKWEKVMDLDVRYHDASLLFDDDDKVYLVTGGGHIHIIELKSDLSGVKTDGLDVQVIDGEKQGFPGLLEGSHINKYNGKYYMFQIWWPQGGIRTQLCFRSDNIAGPYEKKVILSDTLDLAGRGVAQGCIVDTENGEWYGMLFQDHNAVGRVPVLMPCRWENGWPILGDKDGKVAKVMKKPIQGYPEIPLVISDDFNSTKLALNWQWNHNPDNSLWSLTERPGYMRLKTGKVVVNLFEARNTLSQRTEGPKCSGIISMDVSKMKEGDIAGLGAFCAEPGLISVVNEKNKKYLVMTDRGEEKERKELKQTLVYLRMDCDFNTDKANFYYSLNNKEWIRLGTEFKMIYNLVHFMGNRFAIYNYATKTSGGYVDVDWFHVKQESL